MKRHKPTKQNPAAHRAGTARSDAAHQPTQLDATLIAATDLIVILSSQADIDPPADGTPVHTRDTDEPSLRGIDGIERMRPA